MATLLQQSFSIMACTHSLSLLLLVFLASSAYAQQIGDKVMGLDYPEISENCLEALNTTVPSCPSFLIRISVDNPRLNSKQLTALCTPNCRTALTSVRQTIASSCNLDTDIVEFDGVAWPATYVADRFLYTYDLSCRKDSASGQFCDEIFVSWLGSGPASSAQNCSDCMLGVVQTQLNSPFGYHPEFAQDFQSTTASCGAAGYAFTSPAPYSLSTNLAPTPEAPTCSEPYIVQPGESCDAIALSKGVPTYAVIKAGNLNIGCTNLQAGAPLCLPSPCTLYRVQYDETCQSILAQHNGLNAVRLLNWNPNINPLCTNLGPLAETLICVSPPGGDPGEGTPITEPPPTPTEDPATPVPKPTNGKDESNYPCAKWYTIQDGDYCDSVSIRESIALRDFYFLNPSINEQCTNLLLDIAYCVAAVGDINTYPSYPYSTPPLYTLTSATYSTTTQTLSTVAPSITPRTQLPFAPGTISNCESYVEYVPVPAIAVQDSQPVVPVITSNINSCDYATTAFGVLLDDFLSWNPSLSSVDPCLLQQGYRYCVLNSTSSLPPPSTPNGHCIDDAGDSYPGTISTCTCFTRIYGSEAAARLCSDIAIDAEITLSQLTSWNPWVGTDCDTGAYSGLGASDARAICIGVSGGGPVSSSTTTPPTTTTTTPPAPMQTGIVAGCTRYHTVVEGDGCWAIANTYGISLDQFYGWNPAVGNDCGGLWLAYAYCVAV